MTQMQSVTFLLYLLQATQVVKYLVGAKTVVVLTYASTAPTFA